MPPIKSKPRKVQILTVGEKKQIVGKSEVGEILALGTDNEVQADDRLLEQFDQSESDAEDEEREFSEELQFINDGVQEIETQSRQLKQSQITNFLLNNNLKQLKNTAKYKRKCHASQQC